MPLIEDISSLIAQMDMFAQTYPEFQQTMEGCKQAIAQTAQQAQLQQSQPMSGFVPPNQQNMQGEPNPMQGQLGAGGIAGRGNTNPPY